MPGFCRSLEALARRDCYVEGGCARDVGVRECGSRMVHEIDLTLALLVAVAGLATLARVLDVPYPILLVLAGLLVSLVVILVRFVWIVPAVFGLPVLGHRKHWPEAILMRWAGMRGVVSSVA